MKEQEQNDLSKDSELQRKVVLRETVYKNIKIIQTIEIIYVSNEISLLYLHF